MKPNWINASCMMLLAFVCGLAIGRWTVKVRGPLELVDGPRSVELESGRRLPNAPVAPRDALQSATSAARTVEDSPEMQSGDTAQEDSVPPLASDATATERENYLREHKVAYMRGTRDYIAKQLELLETMDPTQSPDFYGVVAGLSASNIALLLDLDGRDVPWVPGVDTVLSGGGDGNLLPGGENGTFRFVHNNWIYEFEQHEFPEHLALCRDVEWTENPENGLRVPKLPAEALDLLRYRAAIALERFDARYAR